MSISQLTFKPSDEAAVRRFEVPDGDLAVMRRIDQLHLDYPFAGSRMLKGLLRRASRWFPAEQRLA